MPSRGKPKIKSIVLIGQHLIDAYGRGPHRVVKWVDTSPGATTPTWRPVINGLRTRHSADKASVTIHGFEGVVWAEAPMQPHGVPALPAERATAKRRETKRRTTGAVIRVPGHGGGLSVTDYFVAQGGLGVTQFYFNGPTRYPAHTSAKDRFVRWMTRTECRLYGVPYVNRAPKRKATSKPAVYTPKVGAKIKVSEIAVGDRLLHLGDPDQRRVVTSMEPLTGFYLNYAMLLGLEARDGAYTYDGRATAEERAKAGLPPEVLGAETRTTEVVLEDPIVQAALASPSGPTKAERVIAALAVGSTATSARVFSAEDVFRLINRPTARHEGGGFLSRQEVAEALTDLIKRRVARSALDGPATAGRTGPFFSLDLGAR